MRAYVYYRDSRYKYRFALGVNTHSQVPGVMSPGILVSWGYSLAASCRFHLRWTQSNWWVTVRIQERGVAWDTTWWEQWGLPGVWRWEKKQKMREKDTGHFFIFCDDLAVHCHIHSWHKHFWTSFPWHTRGLGGGGVKHVNLTFVHAKVVWWQCCIYSVKISPTMVKRGN